MDPQVEEREGMDELMRAKVDEHRDEHVRTIPGGNSSQTLICQSWKKCQCTMILHTYTAVICIDRPLYRNIDCICCCIEHSAKAIHLRF